MGVDSTPTVWPSDTHGIERIGRYLLRCPVSLARIHWSPGTETLFYQGKASHEDPFSHDPEGETLDVFEFLARVLTSLADITFITSGPLLQKPELGKIESG